MSSKWLNLLYIAFKYHFSDWTFLSLLLLLPSSLHICAGHTWWRRHSMWRRLLINGKHRKQADWRMVDFVAGWLGCCVYAGRIRWWRRRDDQWSGWSCRCWKCKEFQLTCIYSFNFLAVVVVVVHGSVCLFGDRLCETKPAMIRFNWAVKQEDLVDQGQI